METTTELYRDISRQYLFEIKEIIEGRDDYIENQNIGGVQFHTYYNNIHFHTGSASGFFSEENGELIPNYFICQDGHIRYTFHQGEETVTFLSKYGEVDYHTTV